MLFYLIFFSIDTFAELALVFKEKDNIEPFIINGEQLDFNNWTNTRILFNSSCNPICTSTFVGPRTLITAAHCTFPIKTIGVMVDNEVNEFNCIYHDDYKPDKSGVVTALEKYEYDFVACHSDDYLFAAGHKFESLDFTKSIVESTPIFLIGYGCTESGGNMVADETKLRGGFALLHDEIKNTQELTKLKYLSVVPSTIDLDADTVICTGDSGGAAYHIHKLDESNTSRSIVGINSLQSTNSNISMLTNIFKC